MASGFRLGNKRQIVLIKETEHVAFGVDIKDKFIFRLVMCYARNIYCLKESGLP